MCSFPWLEAKCRTGRVYELASELFEVNRLKVMFKNQAMINVQIISTYFECDVFVLREFFQFVPNGKQ